jgi:hypothetical protein
VDGHLPILRRCVPGRRSDATQRRPTAPLQAKMTARLKPFHTEREMKACGGDAAAHERFYGSLDVAKARWRRIGRRRLTDLALPSEACWRLPHVPEALNTVDPYSEAACSTWDDLIQLYDALTEARRAWWREEGKQ